MRNGLLLFTGGRKWGDDLHILNRDASLLLAIIDACSNPPLGGSGVSCKKGYLDTIRQLICWSGQLKV